MKNKIEENFHFLNQSFLFHHVIVVVSVVEIDVVIVAVVAVVAVVAAVVVIDVVIVAIVGVDVAVGGVEAAAHRQICRCSGV